MKYWYKKPHTSIAGYVRSVLVLEEYTNVPSSNLPLFTNGLPAMLYQAADNSIAQLTLYGQSPPFDTRIDKIAPLIAYFFKPFALGTIFGISARELKDKPIELSHWNTKKAIEINIQLQSAYTTDKQINILDNFILLQIQNNKKQCEIIKYATDQIMYDPATDILSRILAELKLTERTFQRIFKKYVGITPSQYRRICQFYFAFSQLRTNDYDKLTNIAYSNGYFDQSHYIRSFKEFAGTTPNDYLQFGLPQK